MSGLRVENRLLKYKGITYQISQISSIKIVEVKKKIRKSVSLEPLKLWIPAIIVFGFLGWKLLENDNYLGILSGLISIFFCYPVYDLLKKKKREADLPEFYTLYGLSIRMANGDDPIFISNNRNVMFKVRRAIYTAMNNPHKNVSVKFDNVNIEISDSDKVEIGNVIGG